MKYFILFFLAFTGVAKAEISVCVLNHKTTAETFEKYEVYADNLLYANDWQPTCKDLKKVQNSIGVLSIVVDAAALGSACIGPVTAPVTVSLGIGAVTLEIMDLLVENIPCRDENLDQYIQETTQREVCHTLQNAGYTCNLAEIRNR